MKTVKTLVYFDIEATGLKSSGKPRISEISLVAVNVHDFLNLSVKLSKLKSKPTDKAMLEQVVPRVVNKLTLCVYPMAPILPTVSSITGLDNYNLTEQANFDENTANLLSSFLSRLPRPVCLVAHNGDHYDFPLLKAELEKVDGSIGNDVLCADSYIGIKEIFSSCKNKDPEILHCSEKIDIELQEVEKLIAMGEFDTPMEEDEKISDHVRHSSGSKRSDTTESSLNPTDYQYSQEENETTPMKRKGSSVDNLRPSKFRQVSCSTIFKSRKKLGYTSVKPAKPPSFSLINLHKHLLGCAPVQSHGAEADCLALLRVTATLGQEWLDWLQNNCYVFMDCPKMWGLKVQK